MHVRIKQAELIILTGIRCTHINWRNKKLTFLNFEVERFTDDGWPVNISQLKCKFLKWKTNTASLSKRRSIINVRFRPYFLTNTRVKTKISLPFFIRTENPGSRCVI